MSDNNDLEKRLSALEGGNSAALARKKPSLAVAAVGAAGIALLGGLAYLSLQGDDEASLPTAQPEEFQAEGQGFGEIDPFVPPAPPEPEIQIVETPVEPNAELLAQLAALQAQIEAIKNAPVPVAADNTAAAEAMQALTDRIAALQESSEAAQEQFQDALAQRDRELEKLRMDLELAQLQAPAPAPATSAIDDEEARRLAELERRRQAELAFSSKPALTRPPSPLVAALVRTVHLN